MSPVPLGQWVQEQQQRAVNAEKALATLRARLEQLDKVSGHDIIDAVSGLPGSGPALDGAVLWIRADALDQALAEPPEERSHER